MFGASNLNNVKKVSGHTPHNPRAPHVIFGIGITNCVSRLLAACTTPHHQIQVHHNSANHGQGRGACWSNTSTTTSAHLHTLQSASKRTISKDEWEKRLSEVRIGKEEMNRLIMNFFVTEVCSWHTCCPPPTPPPGLRRRCQGLCCRVGHPAHRRPRHHHRAHANSTVHTERPCGGGHRPRQ